MPWTEQAILQDTQNNTDTLRKLSFMEAIREAQEILLDADPSVFILGEGVDDASGIFGTTIGFPEKYGKERIVDSPLAENGMTGIAIGTAITGMKPIFIHMRCDFLLIAMDQLFNHAAKWSYMSNGQLSVPLTIRAVIGRGWGSAAQHAQSIQALLAHLPGVKVVMPSTAYDAKGLLISSVRDKNPVVILEHRWLYNRFGAVPAGDYSVPLGKASVCRKGKDITVVATSLMVHEAMQAAEQLQALDINIEIIDLRTVKPLDVDSIVASVTKTGRLIVADTGHLFGGIGSEIAATVAEQCFSYLKSPTIRIGLPDSPVPASYPLEQFYYPGVQDIVSKARISMSQ